MSPYYDKLRKLFPKYYDNILEIDELCKCYAWLLDTLVACVNQYINNIFLTDDASIDYIEELEGFYEIVPKEGYTKENRIAYIKSRYSDRVPYDIIRLSQIVSGILGNDFYTIIESYAERILYINLDADKLTDLTNIRVISEVIKQIVPAHIKYIVGIILDVDANSNEYYGCASSVATIYETHTTYTPENPPATWEDVLNDYGTWGDVYNSGKTWKQIYYG